MTQQDHVATLRRLAMGLTVACFVSTVSAQDLPPTAAPEPEAAAPEESATSPAPSANAELSSEVAALRAEVDELKAKQEEAEMAALMNETAEAPIEAETLRIYGFMDFGLDKFIGPSTSNVALVKPATATTFVFGNLNLDVDAWSSFGSPSHRTAKSCPSRTATSASIPRPSTLPARRRNFSSA